MGSLRVVVIGAGIAGISAAAALRSAAASVEIVVLESGSRIGGRIYTDSTSLGFPMDMGASWIHGASPTENPVAAAAAAMGLKMYETAGDGSPLYDHDLKRGFAIFDSRGAAIPRETARRFARWFAAAARSIWNRLERDGGDSSVAAELKRELEAGIRDSEEEEENADLHRRHYQELLGWFMCRIEGWFAADCDRISARAWAGEVLYDGGHALLPCGFSQLVDHLALGLDVRTKHRVVEIAYGGDSSPLRRLRIQTQDGRRFEADAAIFTAPLGVLKSNRIRFNPKLPPRKLEAIERLDIGHQNKIALLFDSTFWPTDCEFLGAANASPSSCSYFLCMFPPTGHPALVYMPAGDLAMEIEALSDGDAASFAMERLREAIPNAPDPVASLVSRWGSDPNFLGCYSFENVAHRDFATREDCSEYGDDPHAMLAETVGGCIFFAGEAASPDYPGTVHGAYQSGIDAARRLLDSYLF